MKKLPIMLFMITVFYLFMTFFIAKKVEKEMKIALVEYKQADVSIELLNYQRHFFTATAISKVQVRIDRETTILFNITSSIIHYPHQAVIKNHIELDDKALSQRAERYFGTPNWITSEQQINLFSQLNGLLTIAPGSYEQGAESFSSLPLRLSYQVDLKEGGGDLQISLQGLKGSSYGTDFSLNSLQFKTHIGELSKQSEYGYKLEIERIELFQQGKHSLLEGFLLTAWSQQGKVKKTIDAVSELQLDSYQFDDGIKQTFTDNRIKLALTGLFQPAFENFDQGSDDIQEVENALIELVSKGAQLTLSQLRSQTPWGEVEGKFDFTFDQGTPVLDILVNPYILFDYISGDASLVLPITLLDEPIVSESLQMGLMTGFLLQNEKTLSLETSFLQGELIVNGRVIPL